MREFETGATRDSDEGKLDFEGFFSPLVLQRYAEYMNKHRVQADGGLRDSDNWQHGIPKDAYIKSGWRHFMDWWMAHRGLPSREGIEEALCALIFNAMGYLFEILKTELQVEVEEKDRVCESCEHLDLMGYEEPCRTCVTGLIPVGWKPK